MASTKHSIFTHPETRSPIVTAVYQSKEHPEVRGVLIRTEGEFNGTYKVLKGWDLVYQVHATSEDYSMYARNNYQPCWAEDDGAGKFTLCEMPEEESQFTLQDVVVDRYLMDQDTGRSVVVINIKPYHADYRNMKFVGRTKADEYFQRTFVRNNFKPFCYEYQYRPMEWLP